MKATFISTHAVSEAMRYKMMRMQSDLVKAQKELTTGRVADPGLALGARSGQAVSLARDVDRLNILIDSNSVIASRLASTQEGLKQLTQIAEDLQAPFATSAGGTVDPAIPEAEAKAALRAVFSILNTSQNGEYLFAGINTDVKPIEDFFEPGSAPRVAFETAFQTRFGITVDHDDVANISAGDMADFIANELQDEFLGAGWGANWSNATDQQIMARITLSESTPASVSANNSGMQKLIMATAMVAELMPANLNDGARKAVLDRALGLVGEAVAELGATQGQVGIIQQRVESASERLSTQVDLFRLHIDDLEGVDPFEVSTRISSLMTQIETSYTLTARIQQLSLVRFLR